MAAEWLTLLDVSTKSIAVALAAALAVPGCTGGSNKGNDRWVTTENTQVDIDWDAVGKAYREADGPKDFERRVNEIYTGSEVVSVRVHDLDEKTQEVTGFFDKDADGAVSDGEKVFTIRRTITGEGSGQYQMNGHNGYASYRSPMWDIAAGMMLGSMLSSAFSPGYRPMYSTPYRTSASRRNALVSQRDSYRSKNPDKFRSGSKSKSGRSYGRKGGSFNKGSSTPSRTRSAPRGRMGGRFGLPARGTRRVIRLA